MRIPLRRREVRVSSQRLNGMRWRSSTKELGHEEVSQIVQPPPLEPRPGTRATKRVEEAELAPRSSLDRLRDERIALPIPNGRQHVAKLWREGHDAFVPALGRTRHTVTHALANDDASAVEIDVSPAEGSYFASPQSGIRGQHERDLMNRERFREKLVDLLARERPRNLPSHPRHTRENGRGFEDSRFDSVAAQHRAEHRLGLSSGGRLESSFHKLGIEAAPVVASIVSIARSPMRGTRKLLKTVRYPSSVEGLNWLAANVRR
jgi:hypothetical protein